MRLCERFIVESDFNHTHIMWLSYWHVTHLHLIFLKYAYTILKLHAYNLQVPCSCLLPPTNSLALTHSHFDNHTYSITLTHTHIPTYPLTITLLHYNHILTDTPILTISISCYHTLPLSHSHSHSYSQTHTFTLLHAHLYGKTQNWLYPIFKHTWIHLPLTIQKHF